MRLSGGEPSEQSAQGVGAKGLERHLAGDRFRREKRRFELNH